MIKYRLHRYFYSSKPVIPLIVILGFIGVMYSMKPMNVTSGYILSGVFQFVLMTFVALNINGSEESVEEQLLFLHGNTLSTYFIAREVSMLIVSLFYGIILSMEPVFVQITNKFSYFNRALTATDVVLGTIIVLASGLAGLAIGDAFHPRIIKDRKIGIACAVAIMVMGIVKEGLVEKYSFLKIFGILLPSIMKPAMDVGSGDYFEIKPVIAFMLLMVLYYLIITIIKNLLLNRKKFS